MPEMRANRTKTRSFTRRLRVIFSTIQVVRMRKLGPTAAAEMMKRKKVDGHTKKPSRKAKGRPRSWLSSAFPVGVVADPTMTIRDPSSPNQGSEVHDRTMRDYAVQIKQAADLLNLSHVSVYPVDVRGLRINSDLTASSNAAYGANPSFGGAAASLQQTRNTNRATTSTSMNLSQQTFILGDEATRETMDTDRKSTRLNSSHLGI